MKAKEIRQMSDAEMDKRMKELKSELFNLRFQLATGQLDNPMRIKGVKKDIARIMTITKERAMSVQKEA
ncbi:MAG: 50S ribosomal protein L29 [Tissierellia bacterium]|jgi:large subunit ribosomal protein L29|nr:50S ribosomal protein L29 [Bacillota bacterium]NLK58888.1 50S ribosomal protein L29 [Tissierellia bacterium]